MLPVRPGRRLIESDSTAKWRVGAPLSAVPARTGSGANSVLSDAPLRLDIEESNGWGWRGKYCAKARQYGSPLLPVLRVDPA